MTKRSDDEGGGFILFVVLFFIILNQCSVDDRLDKIEMKTAYNSEVLG